MSNPSVNAQTGASGTTLTASAHLPSFNAITDRAREVAQQAATQTKEAVQHTKEAVQETYQNVRANAEQGLVRTENYVRENPMPSVLGALAIGTLLGLALGLSRREEPSFRARLADDPLQVIRDAVLTALQPTSEKLHDTYDSAHDVLSGASRRASRRADSWINQLSRASSNLKFW